MTNRLIRWSPEGVVMGATALLIAVMILVPNASILVRSFLVQDADLAPTLSNYSELIQDHEFLLSLRNTLISAAASALLATVLGVALAWIVTRTDTPLREAFYVLNLVPFFLSPFVGALAWSILAAPRSGLINRYLMLLLDRTDPVVNVYSLGGLVWVLALFYTPYVYLFTVGPMRSMDPALEDASRVHGANAFSTSLRITLPLLTPAILSALLLAFVTSSEVFDIPIMLTTPVNIPTLSTLIYTSVQYPPDYGRAAAISVVLVSITMLGVWLQRKVQGGRSFATITGKAYRPRVVQLGRWKYIALTVEVAYLLVAVVLPLAALFLVAVSAVWTGTFKPSLFTWDNFRYVLFSYDLTQRALRNSLVLALTGATAGTLIAFILSYAIHRTGYSWRGWSEVITAIPIGIPGIVLALGFLFVSVRTALYGTLWLILLAYITRFLPYAQRNVAGMLQAISPELEQSARVSGASWFTTNRRILIPLARPGLVAAWLMLFVIYVRELSTSVLLFGHGTETMSVAMLIVSQRNLGYVAAFALIQTLILLGAAAGMMWMARRGEGVQI